MVLIRLKQRLLKEIAGMANIPSLSVQHPQTIYLSQYQRLRMLLLIQQAYLSKTASGSDLVKTIKLTATDDTIQSEGRRVISLHIRLQKQG